MNRMEIIVWGESVESDRCGVSYCTIDTQGCLDSGPEFPTQDEVEDAIREGETSGVTSDGTGWEVARIIN